MMFSNISEVPTALHLSLKIGAADFFKTMIITNDISWCHSPEDYRLNFYYCENLKTPYNYPIIPLHANFIRTAAWHRTHSHDVYRTLLL